MTANPSLPERRSVRSRLIVIGGLFAATGGAAVALFFALAAPAASAAGTCSIYFTGATSNAWATVTNWSLTDGGGSAGRIPNSTDFVCMSTSPTRSTATLAASADVAGINFPDTATVHPILNVNAGPFTVGSVANGSFASTVNNLKLAASTTLGGTAALTVTGSAASIGASAALDGVGTLTLAVGTTTTMNGVTLMNGRRVVNNGSLSVTGPASTNWLTLTTGSVLENAGTLTFTGPNQGFVGSDSDPGNLVKNDSGATLAVSLAAGANVVSVQSPVNLSGTLSATVGHLALNSGGSLAGSWTLGSGTSVDLPGGSFTASALTTTGTGSVKLTGATLSGTATLANALFSSGTVSAPATLTVTNATISGGTFDGAGTLTLAPGGTSAVNTSLSVLSNGFHLVNNGSLSVTGPASSNWVYLATGSVLENAGTLTFTGPDQGFVGSDGDPGNLVKNDSGATLAVSLAAGANVVSIEAPVNLSGTLSATVGHLALDSGGSLTGSWTLGSGTSVDLAGGSFTASALTTTGTGSVKLTGATLSGTATLANALFSSGTVSAPATLTVTNATISGGTFDGAGTLTLAAGGTSAVNTSLSVLSNGFHLVNNGSLSVTGPASSNWVYLATGSVLENAGTLTFTGPDQGFVGSDGDPGNQFKNDSGATLIVAMNVAANTVHISAPSTIQGTLTGTKGHLALENSASLAGAWTLATGTSVDLTGGSAYTATALTVTGAGTVNYTAGTSLSGTATISHLVLASALDGNLTLTLGSGTSASISTLVVLSNGFHLVSNGALSVTGAGSSNWIFLSNGSVLENGGALTFTGPDQGFVGGDGNAANLVKNDAGATITASLNAGATLSSTQPVTNLGTVNVTAGTLNISTLTTLNGSGVLTGGTYQTTGGTLRIPGSIVTNNATVIVSSGSIVNSVTSTNALLALTTNNGTLVSTPSITLTGALTNAGTLTVAGGTFRTTSYTQTAGLTTVASGAILKAGASGTAAVAINAGTLAGVGTVQGAVSGAGTVHPGGGAGPLTVTGSYAGAAAGTVQIDISGPSAPGTDFGQLSVSGNATVPNKLVLATNPGYFPPVGTTYTIVSAGSRTGTFSTVTGQDLSNSTYYKLSYTATTVVLTVTAEPVVSAGSASKVEGNSGTSTMTIPITLNTATDRTVTVSYTTADVTATAGSDYVSTSGTATIAIGQTSTSVSVTINGDTTFEPDETFNLVLSSPANSVLGTASAASTIANDDAAPPTLTVTSLSPSTMGQNATGRAVTISGSGFTASSTVSFSGTGLTVSAPTFVNATTLTVSIDGTTTTPVGARDVTVTDPTNGSNTCVGCFTVTAKPAATGTSPASLQQGATNVEVTVAGTGYQPGATILITGTGAHFTASTSYVSATTLNMLTTVARATSTGVFTIRVTNPDGGKASCTNCLTVTAGPTFTAISPSTAARGSTVSVTLTGTNFVAGAHVVGPIGVTFDSVIVVNSTTITATMTVDTTAKLKPNQKVTVVNPLSAGAGSAPLNGLTITA